MNSTMIPIFVTYNLEANRFVKLNELWNKVVFVDNSEDKLTDIKLRRLYILWNEKNLGYGGGANVGIEQALNLGVNWVIIMNQDLEITRKGLEKFEDELKETNPAIIGSFVGELDHKRWTTILPSKQVDYISGAFMAIHSKVIEKIGLFYEPYFMYYEDADYCVRAKKAGFPLIHVPIAGILHDDRPSLGKGSFLHEYYLARNHLLFIERLAPLQVKSYEYLRLPKTLIEYERRCNLGALAGYKDYFMRRFGEKRVT